MTHTSISPKFQIVLPKAIRERLKLIPKQRLIVMEKGGIIHLIPEVTMKQLKGHFAGQGLSSDNIRDKKDRL